MRSAIEWANAGASSAVVSDCGRYRYALSRERESLLGGGGVLLFVMLNPSTADAHRDDATIRRCRGFADRWGYGRLTVANLYAYRATHPADLDLVDDPVGPDNDEWISRLAFEADRVVVAWGGDVGPIADRAERVLQMLCSEADGPDALALTATGQPRHPLYVRGDAEPEQFRWPA